MADLTTTLCRILDKDKKEINNILGKMPIDQILNLFDAYSDDNENEMKSIVQRIPMANESFYYTQKYITKENDCVEDIIHEALDTIEGNIDDLKISDIECVKNRLENILNKLPCDKENQQPDELVINRVADLIGKYL